MVNPMVKLFQGLDISSCSLSHEVFLLIHVSLTLFCFQMW